ncbi:MAG: HDOD domain-containing protein [Halopseudomonas sp.]
MESPLAPQGIEHWSSLLQDKLLPVPALTLALLRQQLQDPGVSLQQLHPIIGRDPVLAMHCVSLANRLNRNPDTDVSTIELAIATLGLDRIIELIGQLPAIKLNTASVPHKQYFHSLADSYHAATQALSLCRYKDRSIINNTRTAALFYGIGHWALWRYAPQQMSQIKIRIYEQQQDSALAEYEVLGCTIQQVSEQLISHWRLSRLASEALQHQTSPDADLLDQIHLQAEHSAELSDEQKREVKQLLNAPYYPVKLANWLALTAPMGWNHAKTQRIEALINDLLQQDQSETSSLLHQNCVKASREHPMPGLLSPAALMLLQPSELVLNYRMDTTDIGGATAKKPLSSMISPKKINAIKQLSAQQSTSPSPSGTPAPTSATAASTFRDEALYQQVLQQLIKPSAELSERNQVLNLLHRGLVNGLGLERVVSYHINYEMRLTPISHQGCIGDDPLIRFTLNLNIPSLFKKMTHKPLAVWVHNNNRARIWEELPERFKSVCHPQSFALISLFQRDQPALLLYADMQQQSSLISEFQFQKFKQMAVAANRCIAQLGKAGG